MDEPCVLYKLLVQNVDQGSGFKKKVGIARASAAALIRPRTASFSHTSSAAANSPIRVSKHNLKLPEDVRIEQ